MHICQILLLPLQHHADIYTRHAQSKKGHISPNVL